MNVLKSEFSNKQKRLQDRRQKVRKTFFSDYHTITNFLSPAKCIKLPMINENKVEDLVKSSSLLRSNFTNTEKLVNPIVVNSYCSTGTAYEQEVLEHQSSRNDSSTSTSIEFRKILESFINSKQNNVSDTTTEPLEKKDKNDIVFKSYETFFPNFKETEQNFLTSFFQLQEVTDIQQNAQQSTPGALNSTSNSNKNSFLEYNIFQLPVPKNQKSIEEVLNTRTDVQREVSEEVIPSPRKKNRNTGSSRKTPKPKFQKSPKVSGSSKTVTSDSGTFILAVTEGRGHARGEVGIAAMDPRRPQLVLCQISDSQKYVHSLAKMNVFDFVEVIVPNTFVDGSSPKKLYSDIRSTFPNVTLTSVQRRHFSESVGIDLIRHYCSVESTSVMVLLRDKFYALSSAAALIKYVEFTQNMRLAPQSLRIEYQGTEDTMIIDLNTSNLLELVMCANHPETNLNHSLMGVINYCHTKGGMRLLRANILQPSCALSKIETRLNSVSELVGDPLLLYALEASVSSFSKLEDLLNLCMHAPQQDGLRVAEHQLKHTLLLKTMLELLPTLSGVLQGAKSHFFCQVRKNLEDPRYSIILKRILQSVLENAKTVKGSVSVHLHGCFAIKTGINGLLDVAKKTYCEIVQEISDHVAELREKHNLPLRLAFSGNKGFYIQYAVPPGQRGLSASSLPKEFILTHKSKATFSFYTTKLVALDQRCQHVLDEIKLMTNAILFDLLTDIRQHIGCLFNLCEYIAELDLLVSFAHVGSGTNYVRPKFGDELDLKRSRHPILDVIYDGEVVPNDVLAKAGKNFTILTGPNQSGKSIYIRQIALLQIMAQIGCYVPAQEATFRLTDRIFSRIGFDDSIESNASTLIVEMREIEYLKQNRTPRSLVIIDELCRGTSVEEGTSLAFAICEELLDTSTFVFFTTHYLLLTKLEEMYFNVINYHFESKVETDQTGKPTIRFTHLKMAGPTKADSYGLMLAEMTSFPKDVCERAKEISAGLSKSMKPSRAINGLLHEFELSVQLRSELLKLEKEGNLQKMDFVVQSFRQLYESLKKEQVFAKPKEAEESRSLNYQTNGLEEREKTVSKQYKINPRFSRKILVPTEKSGAGKKDRNTRNAVLKLALKIRKKYRKLFLGKNLICQVQAVTD